MNQDTHEFLVRIPNQTVSVPNQNETRYSYHQTPYGHYFRVIKIDPITGKPQEAIAEASLVSGSNQGLISKFRGFLS